MLLLARYVLALFAALENDQVAILSVLTWVCLFLMSILACVRVYKIGLLNALEMMYLVCLLLLALFFTEGDVVQLMAIFRLGCIVSFHIYQCLKHRSFVVRLEQKAKQMIKSLRKKTVPQQVVYNGDADDKSVTRKDVTRSSVRVVELREPLLLQANEQL